MRTWSMMSAGKSEKRDRDTVSEVFWSFIVGGVSFLLALVTVQSFPFISLAHVAVGTLGILAICRVNSIYTAWLSVGLLLFAWSPPGCSILGSNPHLRWDPITAAIYDAPRDSKDTWRSVEVDLTDIDLPKGSNRQAVRARLQRAGFQSSPGPDNPQGFQRTGRTVWLCGESMEVYVDFENDQLARATGYSKWNMCL